MKSTRQIAEIICAEIDRIAKGEVRNETVDALDKCTNSLIKLARLEMDFAARNFGANKPLIPLLVSNGDPEPKATLPPPPAPAPVVEVLKSTTAQGQQIEKQIMDCQKQIKAANGTMKTVLADKIKLLQNKLERVESQKGVQ